MWLPLLIDAHIRLACRIAVQPILERHGLRACMVAPTKIIAGLGMSLGADILDVPGATGLLFPAMDYFHSSNQIQNEGFVSVI